MNRDRRLRRRTGDHHQTLVLSRRIERAAAARSVGPELVASVRKRYQLELVPHFQVEEEILLPALVGPGRADLSERALHEHRTLRAHLEAAEAGSVGALAPFGELLERHVRLEERELLPACEAVVPGRSWMPWMLAW